MWTQGFDRYRGDREFFWLSLCHDTLEGMIRSNFNLMYYHKMPLEMIENLIPWERQIYLTLVIQEMEKQKQAREAMTAGMK